MSNKITAFCPTYNRPDLLPRLIACFEQQTYQNRELIILDDAGQYEPQCGDKWQIVSTTRRFRSLGEKNNAVMAMADFHTEFYAKADDDDIYMPWWLESVAESLRNAEVCQPHLAIDCVDGEWVQSETFNRRKPEFYAYHGCWGFRRAVIEKTGGYRPEYAGDDQEFQRRFRSLGIVSRGIHSRFPPFYWYNRPLEGRISERGGSRQAYMDHLGTGTEVGYVGLLPKWEGEKVWERSIPTKIIQRKW